jgi:rhomboid family protein
MFPIGDDNSQRKSFPIVTTAFIAINVVVFLLELSQGHAFIRQWAFTPASFNAAPPEQAHTVFTAMFMHGGWLHLFGNMLYLWIFGDNIEDRLGRSRFIIFYLLAGIGATFAQFAVNPHSTIPNLGASGAIAGVLGAYLVMFPKARVDVLLIRHVVAMPAWIVLGLWVALQLFSGVGSIVNTTQTASTGGVAYIAHVGGFIAGVILIFLIRAPREPTPLA